MEKGYDDAIAAHDYLAQRFHYNDIEYLMFSAILNPDYPDQLLLLTSMNKTTSL